ncbi:MAG: hypothetical protein G01um101420_474 [Parcubacteria group bacterium Gr01-1014_20]|nr:MAG: hypothetical protein G01um101420_474 [Parcubacteria group bacterium Gr01-1014_20]
MTLTSLNTWGARAGKENLLKFFKDHRDTDVFCLQEIWNGGEHMEGKMAGGAKLKNITFRLFEDIGKTLTGHIGFFRPHFGDHYGLAIFVKKDLKILEEGEIFVYRERGYFSSEEPGNHARNIQFVTLRMPQGVRTMVNFHGLWNGGGKFDSPERLTQSDKIVEFLKNLTDPFVLCGDFNLLPETKSLKKLEVFGLRNLIKEYGFSSTRTKFYTKEHRFADYALASKGIRVKDFKVLPDEVSDHSPLYLDFE